MINLDEIVENFEFLQDWDDRYQYLIDLGKKLPALTAEEKSPQNHIDGCVSNVWMVGSFSGPGNTLELKLDSDAFIVKGLLAMIIQVYGGKTHEQVLDTDINGLFERLGLLEHLSPTRQNGLQAMVERIRGLAVTH